ncbi:MAG: DUF3016 domain-containing protein [Opitutaceae bacterium]
MKCVGTVILLLAYLGFNSLLAKEFIFWKHPGSFTDFSLSSLDNEKDLKHLIDEFERFSRPAIDATFPEDEYEVLILIENIDMAGGYGMNIDFDDWVEIEDIRVIDRNSSALLQLQYEVRDDTGRVLTKGKYRKRAQRIIPFNTYVDPERQFPYIAKLFKEWLTQAKKEATNTKQRDSGGQIK